MIQGESLGAPPRDQSTPGPHSLPSEVGAVLKLGSTKDLGLMFSAKQYQGSRYPIGSPVGREGYVTT